MQGNCLKTAKTKRNQAMECCKIIASLFVVCIHVPFPGKLGVTIAALGKFAVPLFFMISGYFNYQARENSILRRLKHIITLLCAGTLADMLLSCIMTEIHGGSTVARLIQLIPEMDEIMNMLVRHEHPYVGQLWYLIALVTCYVYFWAYTVFWKGKDIDYRPFYQIAVSLGAVSLAFGMLQPSQADAMPLEIRNGWFVGIPFFSAGLFIRQYEELLYRNFRLNAWKLIGLILVGAYISVQESIYMGSGMLPFGTLILVFSLMLLLIAYPCIAKDGGVVAGMISHFGFLSTFIYVMHITLIEWYKEFFQKILEIKMGNAETCFRPIFMILITLTCGIVWKIILDSVKKLVGKVTVK